MRKIGLALLMLISVAIMAGCTKRTTSNKKVEVVSTLNFYGEVASKVGGKYVSVHSVIKNPDVDPHDFEPTAQTAKLVSKANVIVENGVGYDSWINRLSSQEKHVMKINMGNEEHKKEGDNPHLWYRPETMQKLAQKLADDLSKKDPKHSKYYQRNAQKYLDEIKPLDTKYKKLKVKKQELVDVTEPVFDYTLESLGYKVNNVKFALAIENETDPTPAVISKMQNDIRKHKIAFLVNNTQTSSSVIKGLTNLAKEHKVPIVNVTETMPYGKNYQEWMMDQLDQVEKIQEAGK
ncbi:metal ABC transporter substrate-binding protein [Pediococcus claussenii]|uniref:metal ABC transporter solute-binding protein, Zn/Mn family n=1 Tax=Pediococcus claussenii TaxID=187452 RepID=UPI00081A9C50|nr:zinc ABC transporter substrate-binding protein [Pediococcus claussenii]ANZ69701.1 metal ABC transporter substrate-binding protein [Pediococcus claussenii]